MPVSEQVAERLSDLAYVYWLRRREEEEAVVAKQEGKDVPEVTQQQRQKEFAVYLRTVKRIPFQGYSTFDDAKPDPGCYWEVDERQYSYHPVQHKDVSVYRPETVISGDQDNPKIKRLVEQLREAHWKLTAAKGFASLKGIPELQQLLAYTAADVAHYAAESDELGRPGVWRPNFAKERSLYGSYGDLSSLDDNRALARGLSDGGLIGQLAPGLRLCLAAEVATGLLCDSQPLPPDTPEHASALLLFLAAALQQAEQECVPCQYWPAGGSWRLNPSLPNCKTLVDLLACADIQAVLQAGLSMGSACMQAAAGSSSSSSVGSSRLKALQPADSCDNVLLAAYCLAVSVLSAPQQEQQEQQQQQQQSVQGLVSEAASMLEAFLQDLQQQQQQQQQARPEATAAAANGHSSQPGDDSSSSSSSSDGSFLPTAAEVAWHMAVVAGGAALALLLSGLPAGHRPWEQQQQEQQQEQQHKLQQQESGDREMWTGMPAVQLVLLSAAIQALHETMTAALQDAEASTPQQQQQQQRQQARQRHSGTSRQQQGMQQQQQAQQQAQQQGQPHGLRLCAARQQDSTAAALGAVKQRVLTEVLAVVETGRAFQEALCQQQQQQQAAAAAAQSQPGHSGSSSSSGAGNGSSSNPAVLGQAGFTNFLAVLEAIGAVVSKRRQQADGDTAGRLPSNPKETDTFALLQLQVLPHMPFSPQLLFQQLFRLLGQQQLSPVCLHPDAQQQQQLGGTSAQQQQQQQDVSADTLAAIHQALQQSGEVLQAAAASAACEAGALAAEALPQALQRSAENGRQWSAAVTTAYCSWLGDQQQQQQQHGAPGCSSGTPAAAAAAAAGFHGDAAASGGVDRLQLLASDPDTWKCFQKLLQWLLGWQQQWTDAAGQLEVSCVDPRERAIFRHKIALMAQMGHVQLGAKAGQRKEQQQQQQQRKQTGKGAGKKQRQHKASAAAGSSGQGRQAAAAAAGGKDAGDGISSDEEDLWKGETAAQKEFAQLAAAVEECRKCDVCELERKTGLLNSSSSSSGGSPGSSSSSGKASTGLYDSFPVHWSDPYLMRRLLWDLLGRVKPTAQEWFRQYAFMCPHRSQADLWRDVALCIARHLWAPTGQWDDSCEQQLALLLPLRVREPGGLRKEQAVADAAADAAARGQYAQCLSAAYAQQGADGQVAAVLSLQALLSLDPHGGRVQPRPELLFYTPAGFHAAVAKTLMQALQPVPQHQRLLQAHAGGSSLSNGTSAASAAAAGHATRHHHQQQQQQQQEQQQTEDQRSTEPHYLQAWTGAALPVWYMWWHIGLLAYHQQQQQQQQQASAKGSSSSCGGSQTLQETYSSPEARLFAVGYAARQVSSRAQLERLLSNSPTAAAGLAVHPADWALLGQVVCAHCSEEVAQGSAAVCCQLCWNWFCRLTCLLHRCQRGGCRMDPLVKAKSIHRWRVLDLLRPSMTLPQQQQQQQTAGAAAAAAAAGATAAGAVAAGATAAAGATPQAAAGATAGATAAGAGVACIPAATQHALPGLFASLLQQQESRKASARKLLVPGKHQWQKQQEPGLGYCPVLRLFETPVWGLAGIHEPWDGQGKLLKGLTEAAARQHEAKFATSSRDDYCARERSFWAKAQHWRRTSLTPRQQCLEDQREQQRREQQQQQHQRPASWDDYNRSWEQQHVPGRFPQHSYGPHPGALRAAAAAAGAAGGSGGLGLDFDYDPADPLAADSDSSSIGSDLSDASLVDATLFSSFLGRGRGAKGAADGAADNGADELFSGLDLNSHVPVGGGIDSSSGSDEDAGSSAATAAAAAAAPPRRRRHAWGTGDAAAGAGAAGSAGGGEEEGQHEEGQERDNLLRSMLGELPQSGDAGERELAESWLQSGDAGERELAESWLQSAAAGIDARDARALRQEAAERERRLEEELAFLRGFAEAGGGSLLDGVDGFDGLDDYDPLGDEDPFLLQGSLQEEPEEDAAAAAAAAALVSPGPTAAAAGGALEEDKSSSDVGVDSFDFVYDVD